MSSQPKHVTEIRDKTIVISWWRTKSNQSTKLLLLRVMQSEGLSLHAFVCKPIILELIPGSNCNLYPTRTRANEPCLRTFLKFFLLDIEFKASTGILWLLFLSSICSASGFYFFVSRSERGHLVAQEFTVRHILWTWTS